MLARACARSPLLLLVTTGSSRRGPPYQATRSAAGLAALGCVTLPMAARSSHAGNRMGPGVYAASRPRQGSQSASRMAASSPDHGDEQKPPGDSASPRESAYSKEGAPPMESASTEGSASPKRSASPRENAPPRSSRARPRFEDLTEASDFFPVRFPTAENRLPAVARRLAAQGLYPEEPQARREIEAQAAATRVVVHEAVWELLGAFLDHKRAHGTPEEVALYRDMGRAAFARRLIAQRPLTFMGACDYTLLRDGTVITGAPPTDVWDSMGTGTDPEIDPVTDPVNDPETDPVTCHMQGMGGLQLRGELPERQQEGGPAVEAAAAATSQQKGAAGVETVAGHGLSPPPPPLPPVPPHLRLPLAAYLSYDEMQVSALLGTSTPTFFINRGGRHNRGVPAPWGTFEPRGVYLGLVGARFERPGRMEHEWVVLRSLEETQATQLPLRSLETPEGAASRLAMWMRLFGVGGGYWQREVVPLQRRLGELDRLGGPGEGEGVAATCDAPPVINPGSGTGVGAGTRAVTGSDGTGAAAAEKAGSGGLARGAVVPLRGARRALFNGTIYKARMRITAETLLMEAEARARGDPQQRRAYVHVVGLGLGVWAVHPRQAEWYTEAFADALDAIRLPHIAVLDFSYFKVSSLGRHKAGAVTDCPNGNRIKVLFSKRDPADPLGEDEGRPGKGYLLVATYAWDGNTFPGNEYWDGSLDASGDPAAVCCSTLGELQNPLINDFVRNITVLGVSREGEATVTEV